MGANNREQSPHLRAGAQLFDIRVRSTTEPQHVSAGILQYSST